ncbi:hypothetical protein FISHEDRAFT_66352 [Fistulina hepatica ATCC 64428]|uniref:WD40 repeat-like protein n=1 Tax=Fistulina hepatica ATCC 64428 TaxID=1128425 RepID=A0A0D7A7F1_9AGAR|nr:hypothetical protein FISHEDRAFT_66352 [Fistulina hepatica ATCC 64428]
MPLELPGLYYDHERKRYFPISSRLRASGAPGGSSHSSLPPSRDTSSRENSSEDIPVSRIHMKRRTGLWRAQGGLNGLPAYSERDRTLHQIQCIYLAQTSRLQQERIPVYAPIRSFCRAILNGQAHTFIGDSAGWLYSGGESLNEDDWSVDFNLHPDSQVGVTDVLESYSRTSLLTFNNFYDVRSSHLRGDSLVIGAERKALYFPDVSVPTFESLYTHSDVFSVHHDEHLVYAGVRNGSVLRFDLRVAKYGDHLFEERFKGRSRSSVLRLDVVRDTQLLLSHMNGMLATYDLRFTKGNRPLVHFSGHVNTLTEHLGLAVDPLQTFVFAAGQDCVIRGWSLRTGERLAASPLSLDRDASATMETFPPTSLLTTVFKDAVAAIQITEERDGDVCLWATSAGMLYKYYLSQMS